jgi:hypothetical protein
MGFIERSKIRFHYLSPVSIHAVYCLNLFNCSIFRVREVVVINKISIGPWGVLARTRAQSGDRYASGTLHSGQVLRGSLPLLFPAFRRSHFSPPDASTSPTTRALLVAKGGTVGKNVPVILPK